MITIDPRSDRPLHRQLADLLRQQIADGTLAPGTLFVSEKRMAQEFGVGPGTVRRAVGILRGEGLVDTEAPYGTRVRERPLVTEISIPPGALWSTRMPTEQERARPDLDLAEGVPVLEVWLPRKSTPVLYPGDRYVFRNAR